MNIMTTTKSVQIFQKYFPVVFDAPDTGIYRIQDGLFLPVAIGNPENTALF